ncbi:GIY-YIG nuclease family protein [bacterium]|nr:MAG: GIY-YIG nuclease family protein [bacterium]
MFYAYILSLSSGKLYSGYTGDLKRRYGEHKNGKDKFTRKFCPLKLIYYEAFISEKDARKRERYFKTTKGKATLRAMLKDTLIE